MPDISMCRNTTCPVRSDCYRYTAKPSEYQTYSGFIYVETDERIGCDYFWPNNGRLDEEKSSL